MSEVYDSRVRGARLLNLVAVDGCGAAGVAADEFDDLFHARAGSKDGGDALLFQLRNVFVGDDAATEDDHVIEPGFARQLYDARKEGHMRAGQNGQADGVYVFLHGSADNHFGRLPEPG